MNFVKKTLDPLGLTLDDDMGIVFVTSGTNAVGYRVAEGLLSAGYQHVRVGVWKGAREIGGDNAIGQRVADKFEAKGGTVIAFDMTDPEQYQMALAGVKSVFCTIPHMKMNSDTFKLFVDASVKYGVEHFVKMSVFNPNGDPYFATVPYVKFHRKCDEHLTAMKLNSRMTYTLLRPAHLTSTPLIYQGTVLREEGKYITASYAMGVNYVSPNDVASAAVVSLVNRKEHRNKKYNLTGPGLIYDKDVATLLSKFFDKKIEHVALGYNEIKEEYKNRGFPEWLVMDLCNLEKIKASGVDEKKESYTKDLETMINAKAETFAAYLENKDAMTLQENPVPLEI